MSFYYLDEGIKDALRIAEREKQWELLEAQRKAVRLMNKTVEGDISLAAVQGPPGTGKTSVVESFARDKLADFIVSENRELVVYVAPTNHLVFEAFRRVSAQLLKSGYDLRSLLKSIRVYGSKIKPFKSESSRIGDVEATEIKQLVSDIDQDVKIVFATEFQRLSSRLADYVPNKTHIVADEASKSPFFRIFLSLAEKIAREPEEYYPHSLMVLGDPQQAITVPEEYKIIKVPILMKFVQKILRSRNLDDYWVMLNTTFRLPNPSEDPISYGFYDGQLTARYFAKERMKELRDEILDNFTRITHILKQINLGSHSEVEKIAYSIEEALSSNSPIVFIDSRPFRRGDTFDPDRVKLATIASAIFQVANKICQFGHSVTVTAPYSDVVNSVSFRFRRIGIPGPNVATVQAIIGGESDVIIAPLGKEWAPDTVIDQSLTTIYHREPEILNVQLSRHRAMMILIGNFEKLMKSRDQKIKKTALKLSELENEGGVVFVKV